jgi:hypothetical protein
VATPLGVDASVGEDHLEIEPVTLVMSLDDDCEGPVAPPDHMLREPLGERDAAERRDRAHG